MKTYRVTFARRSFRALQRWWFGGRLHFVRDRCRRCDAILDVHGVSIAHLCPTCAVFWGRMTVTAFVRLIWACGPKHEDEVAREILENANYCSVPDERKEVA